MWFIFGTETLPEVIFRQYLCRIKLIIPIAIGTAIKNH